VAPVDPVTAIGSIVGLGLVAAVLAGASAAVFRWYADQRIPTGPAVLIGLSAVAAYLNTRTALGQVVGGDTAFSPMLALFNVGAFAVAAAAGAAGCRAGDHLSAELLVGGVSVENGMNRVVRSVGRAITVEIPADVEDTTGYDPVDAETKAALAGQTFLFPRRLTVDQLRERLVARIESDYDVGHVDVEVTADGEITYLAVGQRVAGIGPTMAPGSVAVAIRADPAYAASSGDVVQIWRSDGSERVCNAELRATAGDVATVVVDEADAPELSPEERYRLVTLSVDGRPDREFASLLRAADETLGVVTVEAGSALAGTPLGALSATVVAVAAPESATPIRTLPTGDHVLAAGESVYVVATPDALRTVEAAAKAPVATPDITAGE
jgi:hypothetical protein